MIERRKQLHRERAARHQEGLRKLNAAAQIFSNVAVSSQISNAVSISPSTAGPLQTPPINAQPTKLPYVENNVIS